MIFLMHDPFRLYSQAYEDVAAGIHERRGTAEKKILRGQIFDSAFDEFPADMPTRTRPLGMRLR